MPDPSRNSLPPWRTARLPCLGLFLSFVIGVCLADGWPALWPVWAAAFLLAGTLAAFWRRSLPVLLAVLCFGGFWTGRRTDSDEGYHLGREPAIADHVHLVRCRIETDPAPVQHYSRPEQRFTGRVVLLDGATAGFAALFSVPGQGLQKGDLLELSGRFSPPEAPRNPGEMDWRSYYARRHLFLRCHLIGSVAVVAKSSENFHRQLRRLRQALDARLAYGIADDAETCLLVRGIMFGDRTGMGPELLDLLERTGTLHLFVVDGLKVTFVAGLSWMLTRALRVGRRLAAAVVCVFLVAYGLLTGFTPSGLRATGMCFLLIVGASVERPGVAINTLGAAGFLLALVDPQFVFETGFQLSFLVVAAILTAVRPLSHWLAQPLARDPFLPPSLESTSRRCIRNVGRHVCELIAVSAICWLASLPILASQFHRVSLSGLALNVIVVPIGSLMLLTGATSIPLGLCSTLLGGYLNNFNWFLAQTFLAILRWSTLLPYDAVNVSLTPPTGPECVLLAGGRDPIFHLHSNRGDSLLNVGTPARWKSTLVPYLRYRGVNSLQAVFLTSKDGMQSGQEAGLQRDFHYGTVIPLTPDPAPPQPGARTASPSGTPASYPLGANVCLEVRAAPGGDSRVGARAGWVVFQLEEFRVGWATSVARAQAREIPGALDILVVSRVSAPVVAQLAAATNAQLVVSLEGQGGTTEVTLPVPVLFLARTGAISFRPAANRRLRVCPFLGNQFILTRRNR